jgi:hypothetical protein
MSEEIKLDEIISINSIAVKLNEYGKYNKVLELIANRINGNKLVTHSDIINLISGLNNNIPVSNHYYLTMLLDSHNRYVQLNRGNPTMYELLELMVSTIETTNNVDELINSYWFTTNDNYIPMHLMVRHYLVYRKLSKENKQIIDDNSLSKLLTMVLFITNEYIKNYSRLVKHYTIMSSLTTGAFELANKLTSPPSDSLYTNTNTSVKASEVIDSLIYRKYNYYITDYKFEGDKILFITSTDEILEFSVFNEMKKDLVSDYLIEVKEQLEMNEAFISGLADNDFTDINGFLDILRTIDIVENKTPNEQK